MTLLVCNRGLLVQELSKETLEIVPWAKVKLKASKNIPMMFCYLSVLYLCVIYCNNTGHGATKQLPELIPWGDVYVSDLKKKRAVKMKLSEPIRSYLVELESGAQLKRNQVHLNPFINNEALRLT